MQKLDRQADRRAGMRRRISEVRRDRYERLERQLFEEAISELESELNSRRLCGPLPSIVATAASVLIPMTVVLGAVARFQHLPWYALAVLALATSSTVAFFGARIWKRSAGSTGLPFSELMLWTWIRHRRAERELISNAQRLGLSRSGEFISATPLSNEEELAVLYRLNAALELKDAYTLGHSRRVERHSYRIALQLGLPAAEIQTLRLAAALHDIGKLVVPDAVLTKSGKLDDHERRLINQHSTAGAKILSILDRPELVAIVRHHHERWDGAGYPDGVSGTDIPLLARVIAVADTYDAITSSRPYRDRSSRRRAIAVIREERGAQFDPEVADAFLRSLHQHPLQSVFGLLLTVPQRFFERISSWMAESTAQIAGAAAGVTGVALVTAASLSGVVTPPGETEVTERPVAAPAIEQRSDEVLGTRIQRKQEDPADRSSKTKDRPPLAKKTDSATPTTPKEVKAAPEVERSSDQARPKAQEPVEPSEAKVVPVPPVPGDPEPTRGEDCAQATGKIAKGHLLHCP